MVIVSEYNAPKGCVEIASTKKQQTMGTGNKGGTNTEKLFVQDRFYERYKGAMNYQIEMDAQSEVIKWHQEKIRWAHRRGIRQ